jgi:hypothetical protein
LRFAITQLAATDGTRTKDLRMLKRKKTQTNVTNLFLTLEHNVRRSILQLLKHGNNGGLCLASNSIQSQAENGANNQMNVDGDRAA